MQDCGPSPAQENALVVGLWPAFTHTGSLITPKHFRKFTIALHHHTSDVIGTTTYTSWPSKETLGVS